MNRTTVLLTGVPQYVTLPDLSYNLDCLFNTDEIGTFKIRDLPNHPVTNKRQIALDFSSGFDAMAAQEKLDGYKYELVNGREYTLSAKINKSEEYMRSESRSPERWDGLNSWLTLEMIGEVSDGAMYRAHAKLDAQLELLKKQKLILETQKELIREKRRLKREYGCMDEYDSANEASTSKRSRTRRSRSRPKHERSRSLTHGTAIKPLSKERGSKLPQVEWHRDRSPKARELRSCSRERRSRSRERRSRSRERRSRSREPALRTHTTTLKSHAKERGSNLPQVEWHRDRASKARELRPRSREPRSRSPRSRERRSRSRESGSRSPAAVKHSKERGSKIPQVEWHCDRASKARKSRLQERSYRSRSRDPRDLRSKIHAPRDQESSKDRSHKSRSTASCELYKRRSRSKSEERNLTIRRPAGSHEEDAHSVQMENISVDVNKNKDGVNKVNSDDVDNDKDRESAAKDNVHDDRAYKKEKSKRKHKRRKEKAEKQITEVNSEITKAEKLPARVQAIAKNIMVLMIILLDEIIRNNDIKISEIDKKLLEKRIEAMIQGRLEPIARVHKDDEVLKIYKSLYQKEDDAAILRIVLAEIPKIVSNEPQATVTSAEVAKQTTEFLPVPVPPCSSEQQQCDPNINCTERKNNVQNIEQEQSSVSAENNGQKNSEVVETIDIFANDPSQAKNNDVNENSVASGNNKDNSPKNRTEMEQEKQEIVTIDLDSTEKPVPRRPMFVLLIRKLGKDMNKVIRTNNLQDDIKPGDIKHVLRFIIKDLVKGQGYMTRDVIMKKFRGIYPKNKDLTFVKNVIKDINDGKYPGLGPNSGAVGTANDCEDDVILIEKQYDVVTVPDSDDDDIIKKTTEMIDLECQSAQTNSRNRPGSTNKNMTIPIRVTSGSTNLEPANSGPLRAKLGNFNIQPGATNASRNQRPLIMARTLLVNRAGLDMPSPDAIRPDPAAPKTGLANIDSAKSVQSYPHLANHLGPAFLNLSKYGPGNLNPAIPGLANLYPMAYAGSTKPVPISKCQTKTKFLPAVLYPLVKPGPLNPTSANPNQDKLSPAELGDKNQEPNLDRAKSSPANTKPNPSNHGPAKPVQVKPKCQIPNEKRMPTSTENQQQLARNNIVDSIVSSECQNLCEMLSNLGVKEHGPDFTRIVNQVVKIRIERILSKSRYLTCKSAMERYKRCYSAESNDTLVRDVCKNALGIELSRNETNEIRETAKTAASNEGSDKDKRGEVRGGYNTPSILGNKTKETDKTDEIRETVASNEVRAKDKREEVAAGAKTPSILGNKTKETDKTDEIRETVASNEVRARDKREEVAAGAKTPSILGNKTKETDKTDEIRETVASNEVRAKDKREEVAAGAKTPSILGNKTKETDKTDESREKDKQKVDEDENCNNSLKVTAITITTSLNELIARTVADETDVANNNIKEEIELEDSNDPEIDRGPQVTSITIMTSEAELLSLSEGEKPSEIKNENTLDYDAGESDVIDNKETECVPNINPTVELEQAVASIERRTPVDEEEETIESIVKYVSGIF